jgi:hypothetical protein
MLGERIGFIKMGIERETKMRDTTNQRKKYGNIYAHAYKADNAPMDWEAYMHQDDPTHLDTREKLEWRTYETKEGRSKAIRELLNNDIKKRVYYFGDILLENMHKQDLSAQETVDINTTIEKIVEDVQRLTEIKNKYGKGDRELAVFRDNEDKIQVWAESEANRDKRFALTEKFLGKEKKFLSLLLKYKDTVSLVSTKEQLEYGIIQLTVKK